jgi:hypothetical protein
MRVAADEVVIDQMEDCSSKWAASIQVSNSMSGRNSYRSPTSWA